jgi:hypothetical protein
MNRTAAWSDQSEPASFRRGGHAVTLKSASAALGLALLLGTGGLFGALAQGSAPDGQKPPAEQEAAKPEETSGERPEEKPEEKPKCVTSNTAWREKGKSTTFEVELLNTCSVRLRCTVDAFVIGARGQAQGHGTIVLAAAPKGQTTRNVYAMKVKSAGGMANISHSCKSV